MFPGISAQSKELKEWQAILHCQLHPPSPVVGISSVYLTLAIYYPRPVLMFLKGLLSGHLSAIQHTVLFLTGAQAPEAEIRSQLQKSAGQWLFCPPMGSHSHYHQTPAFDSTMVKCSVRVSLHTSLFPSSPFECLSFVRGKKSFKIRDVTVVPRQKALGKPQGKATQSSLVLKKGDQQLSCQGPTKTATITEKANI